MKNLNFLLIIIGAAFLCTAQDPSDVKNGGQEQQIDKLFDQIMLTFPEDVKARVDAASCQKMAAPLKTGDQNKSEELVTPRRDELINELPDEVRKQVEKTISEIETRRNEKAIQFRDYKRKDK